MNVGIPALLQLVVLVGGAYIMGWALGWCVGEAVGQLKGFRAGFEAGKKFPAEGRDA